jgi:integrase|nr:site-specific integrase [Enterobacter soli]
MNFPTGVELHNGKIRISFIYRGIRCREVLQGWVVTSGNLRKAGNLRAVIVSEIQLGTFEYAERFPESKALKKFSSTKKITAFGELCDMFMEAKRYEISAATFDSLTSVVKTLRRVVGDNTLLIDIQHSDLLRYRNDLLTGNVVHPIHSSLNKSGRAASTVNGMMSALSTILKLAYRSNFIKHTPYEGLRWLKKTKEPPDPLLPGEYLAFISSLTRSRYAVLLWTIAIHTGLRHGELAALAWEDVDLQKEEINVRRNLTNKNIFVLPKTDAGIRTVSLLKPALEALREQFRITGAMARKQIILHYREPGRTEPLGLRFVFVPPKRTGKSKGHYARNSLAYSWENGLKKAGVRARDPYQSRHTYACWSLSAGANPSFIASQMGHENAKMVYEVYGKWIGEMSKNQVDIINQNLPDALPPVCPLDQFVHSKAL